MKGMKNRANVESAEGEINRARIQFYVIREQEKGRRKGNREQRVRERVNCKKKGDGAI